MACHKASINCLDACKNYSHVGLKQINIYDYSYDILSCQSFTDCLYCYERIGGVKTVDICIHW